MKLLYLMMLGHCINHLAWIFSFLFSANKLKADALLIYTKTGHMASLLSRGRPDCPIFAFTTTSVRRRLNLQWGLMPFSLSLFDDMESNLNRTSSLLKARGMILVTLSLSSVISFNQFKWLMFPEPEHLLHSTHTIIHLYISLHLK